MVGYRQRPFHIPVGHDNAGNKAGAHDVAPDKIGLNEVTEGFGFDTVFGKTHQELFDRQIGPAGEFCQSRRDVLFGEFHAVGDPGRETQPVIDQSADRRCFQIAR